MKRAFDLPHGSLLLMAGATQQHYLHAVPKTRREVGERINLTYRTVRHGAALAIPPAGDGRASHNDARRMDGDRQLPVA